MPRGGAKPGERRGGRRKGTPNRKTAEIAKEALGNGLTPLQYMLKVLRNSKNDQSVRLDAAKSAAPYVHPRLSAVALHGANDDGSFTFNVRLIGADARA